MTYKGGNRHKESKGHITLKMTFIYSGQFYWRIGIRDTNIVRGFAKITQ